MENPDQSNNNSLTWLQKLQKNRLQFLSIVPGMCTHTEFINL